MLSRCLLSALKWTYRISVSNQNFLILIKYFLVNLSITQLLCCLRHGKNDKSLISPSFNYSMVGVNVWYTSKARKWGRTHFALTLLSHTFFFISASNFCHHQTFWLEIAKVKTCLRERNMQVFHITVIKSPTKCTLQSTHSEKEK